MERMNVVCFSIYRRLGREVWNTASQRDTACVPGESKDLEKMERWTERDRGRRRRSKRRGCTDAWRNLQTQDMWLRSWRPTANIVAVSMYFGRKILCTVESNEADRFEQTIDAQRSINDNLSYASTTERRPNSTPTITCLARLTRRRPITRRLVRRAGQMIIYVIFDLRSVFRSVR